VACQFVDPQLNNIVAALLFSKIQFGAKLFWGGRLLHVFLSLKNMVGVKV
jgi:hypothetical protein